MDAAEYSDEEEAAYFGRKQRPKLPAKAREDKSSKRTDKSSKRTDKSSKRTDKGSKPTVTRRRLKHPVQPQATKTKHAAARPKGPATGVSRQSLG